MFILTKLSLFPICYFLNGSASLQSPQSPRSRERDRELAFETIEDDDEEDLEDDQERGQ